MPNTDMNPPSKFKSFQDSSPQMQHSTDHPRDQRSSQHNSIENRDSPSSYAVEDYDIQGLNTQSFTQNPRQTLTDTPIQRPRSTSNLELQFSIPGSFTQEENDPRSQSGKQDSYFIPRRRREDREIDLEGQYPSIHTPRNHLEYDLDSSFADRYRRTSDTHDQRSSPYFEHRVNESQSPYSNTQDAHQNTNPESTTALTPRPCRRSHPENESPRADLLFNSLDYTIDDIESQSFRAPKPPVNPIDLDFSGVIHTLRRPIDYFGGNKEEMKEMW
ncbi:hypothetical protein BCON_0001g00230 [Botryotinia convoluta]|uniref:Uncharacterized protein n=1 Tax=Botryotinia convoluta TaxID=54673 RepID=A0A4Z1IW46_9HELO|nr:hypothetical protein BCON_0001g00230 [Botryotinia convoluta]